MRVFVQVFATVGLLTTFAFSPIPRTLSYQGVLTDSVGTPRPDGAYTFTFSLYNLISGGTRLWSETKSLNLKRGLFSTSLGDLTPFPDSLKFDRAYWLEVSVSGIGTLVPRSPLTSVGYSMNSLRADTAKVTIAGGAWTKTDSSTYFLNGNVGVGTSVPGAKLEISGGPRWTTGRWFRSMKIQNGSALEIDGVDPRKYGLGASSSDSSLYLFTTTSEGTDGVPQYRMRLRDNGELDIGNSSGPFGALSVWQSSNSDYAALIHNGGGSGLGLCIEGGIAGDNYDYPLLWVGSHDGQTCRFFVNGNGNVGVGTASPSTRLDVNGRTRTSVLEITGSDFAEPFEISHTDSLPLGSLVVIDPENPGKLKQATEPYDKRVAGVISGAGGIFPGIMVSKEGKARNSQYVAMSGKVYALATASNSAIEPGDLLTTSSLPGRAMKATDKEKLTGTVIGKAMSSLQSGTGLVLVLVNLQ